MCTGRAAMQTSGGNGANSAGGINGTNSTASSSPAPSGSTVSNTAAATGGASTGSRSGPAPGGGTYSGMATSDYASRAATQQQAQEMAVQRARAEALKGCLTERGYREFALTAEQRTHLSTLKKGSAEYHEYLYQLGSDAAIVGKQSRAPGP
jgi:3-oxoacyl-ACP reductase-like protein